MMAAETNLELDRGKLTLSADRYEDRTQPWARCRRARRAVRINLRRSDASGIAARVGRFRIGAGQDHRDIKRIAVCGKYFCAVAIRGNPYGARAYWDRLC